MAMSRFSREKDLGKIFTTVVILAIVVFFLWIAFGDRDDGSSKKNENSRKSPFNKAYRDILNRRGPGFQ